MKQTEFATRADSKSSKRVLGRELINAAGRTTCESPLCPDSRRIIASQRTDAKGQRQTGLILNDVLVLDQPNQPRRVVFSYGTRDEPTVPYVLILHQPRSDWDQFLSQAQGRLWFQADGVQRRGVQLSAGGQATQFELHLNFCDGCDSFLDQIRQTSKLVGKVGEEAVPSELKDSLLTAFRDWGRS